jgi:tRNA pseudouridine55 synthase
MKTDQLLLIDKPANMTSFGVVARVRRQLSEQVGHRVKVGHTGTLDPFATGLMIILTGKMTKQAERFSKLDKVYDATIRLGATSTTGDPEGEISLTAATDQPNLATVEQTLRTFVGKIKQTPPIYSAIKVGGQRAYKLARQGKAVELPPREVTIFGLELVSYAYPDLNIRVHCSSGTYIRSLAVDIGEKLGVGAYTLALRRLQVGDYKLESAQTLSENLALTN